MGLAYSTVSTILKDKVKMKETAKVMTRYKAVITRQREDLMNQMEKLLVIWIDDQIKQLPKLKQ